ncbi:fluoride efflux transporter CrcB [Massilia norwichensis]|uniref:Fluoride-specific ion channel FluC n=1 Tax=Massilia norwichensis TaxID=1442366 RepID=A0ABT2A7I4_9BURK|nr:fluoride efflux transporter CrcB [Massilia norwichensis]MCS0590148.1 fluoride efflux transporter CrcB [Massilia norwichensis]
MSWVAVGVGAALGAWLRWGLGIFLGQLHSHIQIGTLVANLVGGYLIGLALGFFGSHPGLSPEWRLFAITGFLGGLTTFSSFSGEAMVLLQRGDYGWALAHSSLHLLGSIGCCAAGFATWRAIA